MQENNATLQPAVESVGWENFLKAQMADLMAVPLNQRWMSHVNQMLVNPTLMDVVVLILTLIINHNNVDVHIINWLSTAIPYCDILHSFPWHAKVFCFLQLYCQHM